MVLAIYRGMLGGGGQYDLLLWLMGGALLLVATLGTLWTGNLAPEPQGVLVRSGRLPLVPVPLETLVPGLLAIGAVLFLPVFVNGVLQGLVVVLVGAAFAGVLWAQAHGRDTADRYFALSQTILNITAHVTAFVLFSVIYGMKIRSVASATAVGVVATLLLIELLTRDAAWHTAMNLPAESRRTTINLLALTGGVVLAEVTWGLNYWAALSTLIGGALLLVVFYVMFGITSSYVDRRLNRQVLLEYGLVGTVGVLAVFGSAFLG